MRIVANRLRVVQERSGLHALQVSYTREPDLSGSLEGAGGIGGLLARTDNPANTHAFYHADGNGNVTYLVNSSQTLAASYRYDAYGNTMSSSGSLASANRYRFSSKEHFDRGIQTGWMPLYYYGYRWYAPIMQRWVNRDPIQEEGGINLYRYALNDSVNFLDPNGQVPIAIPIAIGGIRACLANPACAAALQRALQALAAAGAGLLVAEVCRGRPRTPECDKEWEDAYRRCEREFAKPWPDPYNTGGHWNLQDCAKGFVTEDCGGNPTSMSQWPGIGGIIGKNAPPVIVLPLR